MNPITFLTIPLLLTSHAAFPGSVDANGALALAVVVAEHLPSVKASDEIVLEKFLNGQTNVPYPPNKKIVVAADAVTCRASDIDITLHSCDLSFGAKCDLSFGAKKVTTPAGRRTKTLPDSRRGGSAAGPPWVRASRPCPIWLAQSIQPK